MTKSVNHLPHAIKEFKKLNESQLIVGVPLDDDFLQMIARVNENGMTIKPKHGKYLSVPNGKGGIVKLKKVKIPARPFMRYTVNHKKRQWAILVTTEANKIMLGQQDADGLLETLGKRIKTDIQKTITHWKSPKNAPLTVANKGKDNPLEDTGKLRNSITYKVERRDIE